VRHAVLGAALALGAILVSTLPAAEHGWESFDQTSFDRAKAAGKTVVLDCHAPWCPICKAQQASLAHLLAQPEFAGVVGFVIDYDSATQVRGALHITRPSTLVVYKGMVEVGRSTGATDEATVRALIRAGL
jgi:thiol-disulfide isomerase/thioredoxin